MYYSTECESPVGRLTLGSDGKNLAGVWIEGQKYFGAGIPEPMMPNDSLPIFKQTKDWLERYFAGKKPSASELSLAPIGGKFRQEVWKLLSEIPYGEVITYGELAKKIAVKLERMSMSSQAVGGAVGHNPISILIPCHRVVGTNGSLTGYAGGLEKKIKLLTLEGVDMSRFFVPQKGTAL
ncbi:MAG: methylated-DNA--[protein]-cysteine S-methyltransferase [Lachnospiraceae bacterium]|jgi:methylated-DNA-[protein]-cysteine S-methyltransferase|nr:methylated-DNA--[protein]-cysteine S-methyltransferase [Lachnospiraceae bacterium]